MQLRQVLTEWSEISIGGTMQDCNQVSLLPKPPLLITESAEEFDAIHEHLIRVIQPVDIIDQMYVSDMAHLAWERVRWRRCKAGIINAGYRTAMEKIFPELLRDP